jgi:hypothetical protein
MESLTSDQRGELKELMSEHPNRKSLTWGRYNYLAENAEREIENYPQFANLVRDEFETLKKLVFLGILNDTDPTPWTEPLTWSVKDKIAEQEKKAEVVPHQVLGQALYDFYKPRSWRGVTESPQKIATMRINYTTHNIEFSTLVVEHSFTPTMTLPLNSITECYTRSLMYNPLREGNFNRSGQVSVVFDFDKIPAGEHEQLIQAAGGRENGRNKILIHPTTENKMGDGQVNMRYFHTKILEAARAASAKITRTQAGGGKKSRRKSRRKSTKRRKYNKRRKSTKRKYTKRRKSKTRRRRR